jgi:hypothetical protein
MNTMRPDQIREAMEAQRRKDLRDQVIVVIVCIILIVVMIAGIIAGIS